MVQPENGLDHFSYPASIAQRQERAEQHKYQRSDPNQPWRHTAHATMMTTTHSTSSRSDSGTKHHTHHQRLEDFTVSLRRCAWHNCPQLVPQGQRFCHAHAHAYNQQRGSSTARGYDAAHRHLRRQWEARLATGETHTCAKCGQPVTATDQWDLGHTDNRQSWTGPEHRSCNRKDGQHKAAASIEHWTRHQAKPQQQPQSQPTGKRERKHDTTQTNQTQADKPNKHTQQKQQNTHQTGKNTINQPANTPRGVPRTARPRPPVRGLASSRIVQDLTDWPSL